MAKNNKVVIGIQSRLRSSRLPAKALLKLGDHSTLGFLIERSKSANIPIYILTSEDSPDDLIEIEALKYSPSGIIRGSHDDVLQRYSKLQKKTNADIIVRVTADNPFTDFRLIPILLSFMEENNLSYATVDKKNALEGTNLELFSNKILDFSFKNDISPFNKENVTPFMIKKEKNHNLINPIQTKYMTKKSIIDYSVTLDTIKDYIKINRMLLEMKKFIKNINQEDFINVVLNLVNTKDFYPIGRNHPI